MTSFHLKPNITYTMNITVYGAFVKEGSFLLLSVFSFISLIQQAYI